MTARSTALQRKARYIDARPATDSLYVFAQMLERHGANVIRCPLVAIRDVPDPAPVVAWLQRFTSNFPDDFVLLTGSALRAAPA
jgi:uroporphyrinogen-III synthase